MEMGLANGLWNDSVYPLQLICRDGFVGQHLGFLH